MSDTEAWKIAKETESNLRKMLDDMRRQRDAALSELRKLKEGRVLGNVPLAWRFEIACYYTKETDTYSGWEWRTTDYPPSAWRGVRNVTPLYSLEMKK